MNKSSSSLKHWHLPDEEPHSQGLTRNVCKKTGVCIKADSQRPLDVQQLPNIAHSQGERVEGSPAC